MADIISGKNRIEYTVKRSMRSRYLRITVKADGVVVSAPAFIDEKVIADFVDQKKNWIIKKVGDLEKKSKFFERKYEGGEALYVLGNRLSLLPVEYQGQLTKVHQEGEHLAVFIKYGFTKAERRQEIMHRVKQWYIEQARAVFTERVAHFAEQMSLSYNSIRIKEQKTLWGSCSGRGNLNFNWKLVMAPLDIINYVVVHELCHIQQMNHSPRFWSLVEKYIPDYKVKRKWLKDHGSGLSLE